MPTRENRSTRVQSMAVEIASRIRADGAREVLGLEVTAGEDLKAWLTFLKSRMARVARGVRLVVSDAHSDPRRGISEVLGGGRPAALSAHFPRNVLARVSKSAQGYESSLS